MVKRKTGWGRGDELGRLLNVGEKKHSYGIVYGLWEDRKRKSRATNLNLPPISRRNSAREKRHLARELHLSLRAIVGRQASAGVYFPREANLTRQFPFLDRSSRPIQLNTELRSQRASRRKSLKRRPGRWLRGRSFFRLRLFRRRDDDRWSPSLRCLFRPSEWVMDMSISVSPVSECSGT